MIKASVSGDVKVLPDTRTKFERLNRMSLYRLLRYNGFDVHDSMPKTKMIQMCELDEERLVVVNGDGGYAYKNVKVGVDPINGQVHILRDLDKEAKQDEEKAVKKAPVKDTISEPEEASAVKTEKK